MRAACQARACQIVDASQLYDYTAQRVEFSRYSETDRQCVHYLTQSDFARLADSRVILTIREYNLCRVLERPFFC